MTHKKKLSKYGKVVSCKVINDTVATIILTDGFSANAVTTFDFLRACTECFPDFPVMATCITEKNLAIVFLTRNQ